MKTHITALSLAALFCASSCALEVGDGRLETQSRTVDAVFTRVAFHSGIRGQAAPGPQALSISTDANLIGLVETFVENETLVVRVRPDVMVSTQLGIVAQVVTEVVRGVEGHGGSRVTATASPAERFVASASGGSTLDVWALDAARLGVDASGGSRLTVEGTAVEVNLIASGGSQVDTRAVGAADLTLDGSGGSALWARASHEVRGQLSGGSRATVVGNPAIRDVALSGGSTVTFSGEQ